MPLKNDGIGYSVRTFRTRPGNVRRLSSLLSQHVGYEPFRIKRPDVAIILSRPKKDDGDAHFVAYAE